MRIFHGFDAIEGQINNAVCTLGSYDGIHIGHRELIREVIKQAKECGGESVVLTFEPHPRIALGKADGLKLLTSLNEKAELLRELGIDNLVVIPFDREFSRLAYRDFVKSYLIEKLNIKRFIMGYNHRLGRGNEGTFSTLTELSATHGFEISQVKELRSSDDKVSSTVIRNLMAEGLISDSARLLGRAYIIMGEMNRNGEISVEGSPLKLLPPVGVYQATINGTTAEIEIKTDGKICVMGYAHNNGGEHVKIELSNDPKK